MKLKDMDEKSRNALLRVWGQRQPTKQADKFEMPKAKYKKLVIQQGNRCAICGKHPGKRRLAVDHDHTDGSFRGLLCANCNTGLGMFMDNPDALRAALRYLEAHSEWRNRLISTPQGRLN